MAPGHSQITNKHDDGCSSNSSFTPGTYPRKKKETGGVQVVLPSFIVGEHSLACAKEEQQIKLRHARSFIDALLLWHSLLVETTQSTLKKAACHQVHTGIIAVSTRSITGVHS